ncbi:ATP-binding protein [Vibrio sp. 05-20-BW147]|uniref:PAS domain-containing sensor histidine kinase n=1 Tax=Vibrio sp. 05-20-BW147 TaxID=2575834 RepID=UPI0015941CF1|nr:ATP-binding protein [Vibrio sp. 05-20-BW147]NVC61690.1 ATP-binding protein [Vibrio sp. 05-20-BW147]
MSRKTRYQESLNNPLFSRIGRRIILIMILLSGAFTLLTTLLQLYWDYDKEFNDVEQRHHEIHTVHAGLLSASLWSFDLVLLQERLDGLVNLPKIDYLEVQSGNYTFNSGEKVAEGAIIDTYPLSYYNDISGTREELGTIYVESDAHEIYHYLLKQFLVTLTLNAMKTALVCYIILMIFHASVNRRIFEIAQYLRNYNPRHPSDPLQLAHYQWIMENDDELDWLGDETNRITGNVTTLYRNIKQEQERLADFTHVSSDWLWETDELGRLTYCSDAMINALNVNPMEKPLFTEIDALSEAHNLTSYILRRNDFSMCEESIILNCITYHFLFQAIAKYEENKFLGFRGTTINITDLKLTQIELQQLNQNLEHEVAVRTLDLKQSMEQLKATQEQLVESEKLAALGGLVAGVAHEVNTPLGIAVTASSIIRDASNELNQAFSNQTLTSAQFADVMQRISDSSQMLENNLNRAAKLIRDFKQTAVDQISESRSEFNVKQVLDALIASLHPETRKVPVAPIVESPEDVIMNSLPGVLTQIVSNLVLNSVNHAFSTQPNPEILVRISEQEQNVILEYQDNGAGVDQSLHQKIFEPFYTSKRGKGGSGLGLNLVFNLVKQKLKGDLSFHSEPNQGVHFVITLPKELPMQIEFAQKSA